jgi:hypothetical protein
MNYSKEDIWNQAKEDNYAVGVNGAGYDSRMVYGVKIIKDSDGSIKLFNTMLGGDYYKPISEIDLIDFLENGWRYGVYVLSLSNYCAKLDIVERKIQKEISGRASVKQISGYKVHRDNLISKHRDVTNKLNQLKSNRNGNSQENRREVGL